MNQTDLKFFTNEPERDLYSRFAAILKSNTQFFDILVGYFRSSGFFKMYEALESVEKIRILVGLNVDKFTVKVIDRATNEARAVSYTHLDVYKRQQQAPTGKSFAFVECVDYRRTPRELNNYDELSLIHI